MDNLFSLAGRKALVTGAAGGLGAHFARTLGAAGAQLVLAGRRIEPLKQLQEVLEQSGVTAIAVTPDCSSTSCNCLSGRSEEHTSELQSRENLVCRLLLEKKNYHK